MAAPTSSHNFLCLVCNPKQTTTHHFSNNSLPRNLNALFQKPKFSRHTRLKHTKNSEQNHFCTILGDSRTQTRLPASFTWAVHIKSIITWSTQTEITSFFFLQNIDSSGNNISKNQVILTSTTIPK